MNTGIPELDKLLGHNPDKDVEHRGSIPIGSAVLIRGQAGSGKTTLGLQLLNQHLANTNAYAAFVSLEVPPDIVVDRMHASFHFNSLARNSTSGKVPRLVEIGREDLIANRVFKGGQELGAELTTAVLENLKKEPSDFTRKGRGDDSAEIAILIDSLLLLTDIAVHQYKAEDLRELLVQIRTGIRSRLPDATILMTAEQHHFHSLFGESFYSDIEIQLAQEAVAGQIAGKSGTSPLGYVIERSSTRSEDQDQPQAVIGRSFCRIIKNRFWKNQSRRCAYDIVSEIGVRFFETYPGDGQMVLFAENDPQRIIWKDFFRSEVPHRYPAMRYQTFDTSGTQRTFATQRTLKYMPDRTDLFFSSFDTYWVKWFVDFCHRGDIARFVALALNGTRDECANHKCEIISIVHEYWMEATSSGDCDDLGAIESGHVCEMLGRIKSFLAAKEFALGQKEELYFKEALGSLVLALTSNDANCGLFEPLKEDELRLFGEHRSAIIGPLNELRTDERRPIHYFRQSNTSKVLLTIPYDANVGIFVCRKDQLAPLLDKHYPKGVGVAQRIVDITEEDRNATLAFTQTKGFQALIESTKSKDKEVEPILNQLLVPTLQLRNYAEELETELMANGQPKTWEEVIAICQLLKKNLLLETKTLESYVATLLELVWNYGGSIHITPGYRISDKAHTAISLFRALLMLRRMFALNIVPSNSSNDPEYVAEAFGVTDGSPQHGLQDDWVFARHWYSTLVDLLSRRNGEGFVWGKKAIRLAVAPIPVGFPHFVQQRKKGEHGVIHRSCWGEWHFGILRGSENRALGVDLINNLMSAQKVCERAFECAALPTTDEFYLRYRKRRAFEVPRRPTASLPDFRFGDFYDKIFPFAKSRSSIFDYRHCMRMLHSLMETVSSKPSLQPDQIGVKLLETFESIEALRNKPLMQA